MAQVWQWPYIWIKWTHWTVWSNLDYFSFSKNGALLGKSQAMISKWGQMRGYLYYALGFSVAPVLLILVLSLFRKYLTDCTYGRPKYRPEHRYYYFGLIVLRCAYLPICLAVSRLYDCTDGTLSADPSVKCWTGLHLIISLVCFVLTFPFFVGLPVLLYRLVADSVIYDAEYDHEKRLQAWEMEYTFHLGDYFERSQLWLCSSFRRHAAYFTVLIHCFKAFALLLFLLCRPIVHLQAALFWFGTLICTGYVVWSLPYRLHSTNVELCTVAILLFISASFGLFNAFGVQNSVLVASTETVILLSFHAAGFAVLIALLLFGLVTHANWPAQRTMNRLRNSSLWPSVLVWMDTIREAQAVDLDCYRCIPEAVDILGLENSLRSLRRDWFAASSVGSVFAVIIRENIEHLLLTHSHFLPLALRRHEYLDKAWVDGGGEAFRRREHTYRLTAPKKRRIITKLFALKALLGDRVINREVSRGGSDDDEEKEPLTDQYGMDMTKHKKLAALLLSDEENQLQPKSQKPRRRSVQEVQDEQKLQLQIWNSAEEFTRRKEQVSSLSALTEDFLQNYKLKYQPQQRLASNLLMPGEVSATLEQFSELYQRWDEVIGSFERRELPGGGLFTALDEEEWLTYRFTLQEKWRDFELQIASQNETQSQAQAQAQAPRSDEKAAGDSPIEESPNELAIEGKVSDGGEGRGDGAEPSELDEGPVGGGRGDD
jgi:hypothetical protein